MADVITTLHPEGAPEDNLYPNVKDENIPSNIERKGVVLWENANPDSVAGFPASDITLADNISNYSKIAVTFKPFYTAQGCIERIFSPLQTLNQIDCVSVLADENLSSCRQFYKDGDRGLSFGVNYTNQQVANNRCVPVAVYGIK